MREALSITLTLAALGALLALALSPFVARLRRTANGSRPKAGLHWGGAMLALAVASDLLAPKQDRPATPATVATVAQQQVKAEALPAPQIGADQRATTPSPTSPPAQATAAPQPTPAIAAQAAPEPTDLPAGWADWAKPRLNSIPTQCTNNHIEFERLACSLETQRSRLGYMAALFVIAPACGLRNREWAEDLLTALGAALAEAPDPAEPRDHGQNGRLLRSQQRLGANFLVEDQPGTCRQARRETAQLAEADRLVAGWRRSHREFNACLRRGKGSCGIVPVN